MPSAYPKLRTIGLFQDLSDELLLHIEQRCRWHRFRSQQLILDRDTESRDVFFVLEGRVRVVNYTRSGREIAFAVLEAGTHFGELSAIDGRPRSATIVALASCEIATLSAAAFHEVLRSEPDVAAALLVALAGMVRSADERIAELSSFSAFHRVYREILRLADLQSEDGDRISNLPTQQDIAGITSTTRETVARAIANLTKAGAAHRQGRVLIIEDRDFIEDLLESVADV